MLLLMAGMAGGQTIDITSFQTNGVFDAYTNRGVLSRTNLIITKEERDVVPLTCDGAGEFLNPGNLTNWVELN